MKESTVFITGAKQGEEAAKDLNSLMAFREGFLKAIFGEGYRVCDQLMDFLLSGWW